MGEVRLHACCGRVASSIAASESGREGLSAPTDECTGQASQPGMAQPGCSQACAAHLRTVPAQPTPRTFSACVHSRARSEGMVNIQMDHMLRQRAGRVAAAAGVA